MDSLSQIDTCSNTCLWSALLARRVASSFERTVKDNVQSVVPDTADHPKGQRIKTKKQREAVLLEEEVRLRKLRHQQCNFDRSETKTKHDYYREKYNLGNSTVQIQEASSQKELTGILLKRGKLNKAFKMRRFQLKNAQLTYHEPQTLVVKGKISVPDVTDITITEPSEMCPEMQIQTTVRLYTLRSPTNSYNELRQWKDAINSSRYLDQGKSTNHN